MASSSSIVALQTPLPNMYPVTGASGGAMRRPWERMPTQFVRREPCHSSCRLPTEDLKSAASLPRAALKTCFTFKSSQAKSSQVKPTQANSSEVKRREGG